MAEVSKVRPDAALPSDPIQIISTILKTAPVRYAVIGCWALGLAATIGWRVAFVWFCATTVAGAARGWVEGRIARRQRDKLGLVFTAVALVAGCFWAAAPLLAWFSGRAFGQALALAFLCSGYLLVFTQLRDSPKQALAISSPYTAATLAIGYSAWGGPLFWPFLATLPFIWAGLAVHVMLSVIMQSTIRTSATRQAQLIEDLAAARDAADTANAAKSAFLATMSHEIRTPLNGVLGMAQAMAHDDLPSVQHERLGVIRGAGETLLVLLNDLLDLSRIEAGRLELEDGVVDIVLIAENAKSTFEVLASEKDISFDLHCSAAVRRPWKGDPTRVRQIVYNLISNAVKFTQTGSIRVVIDHDDRGLLIEVVDTGDGIPPDRLGVLFDKFVQADASTTRKHGGSGLGLAICRDLAGLMGGEISVTSTVGKGSTFAVRLPLEPANGSTPRAAEEPTASWDETSPLKVLAAEDNPTNQLVLTTLLAQVGMEVEIARDGREAVEAWRAGEWDIILMDVHMPVLDGIEATRAIREEERRSGRPRTPILALTADAMTHHADQYIACGMDGLIAKPVGLELMLAQIAAVLPTPGGAPVTEVELPRDPRAEVAVS